MQDRPRIPIIVDLPREEPKLGFDRYIDAIAGAIRGGEPCQFTLGLYGPWGSGKSSVLSGLSKALNDDETVSVPFNAWRHERVENLLAVLLWSVKDALDEQVKEKRRTTKFANWLSGLELSAAGFGVRFPTAQDRESGSANTMEEDITRYMTMLSSLEDAATQVGKRIVVLIDDLDRCSPDRVVEVLEAIRLFMDVPGFVFVLAVDYDVLTEALRERYTHLDPHRFLEKIVQVPFWIPPLNLDTEEFLDELVEHWDDLRKSWFDGVNTKDLQGIIRLALRGNPRQAKRLLNSFMIAKQIAGNGGVNPVLLLPSLAVQLAWPRQFSELQHALTNEDQSGSTLGDVAAYNLLASNTDEDSLLGEFLAKYLPSETPIGDAEVTMRLANDYGSGPAISETEYVECTYEGEPDRFKRIWANRRFTDQEVQELKDGKTISFQYTNRDGIERTATGNLQRRSYNGTTYLGFAFI